MQYIVFCEDYFYYTENIENISCFRSSRGILRFIYSCDLYPRDLKLNLQGITKMILKIDCLRFLRCKFVKGNVTE